MRRHQGHQGREGGHVVLALLLMGVAATGLALAAFRIPDSELVRLAQQQRQFALVREALIARAVNDGTRPGSLPCPSVDGTAPLLAGQNCPQRLGGLPWRTLKIPVPLDLSHAPWRYLIAPGLQDSEKNYPINSDHASGLVSDLGVVAEANIAAVLIAPGPALPGQKRPGTQPADYTELALSEHGDGLHFSLPAHANDRLYLIRRDEVMAAVERRVIRSVLRCLDEHARYSEGEIPWAAPLASSEYHAETDCRLGRVPRTFAIASLTQLAQKTATVLQQAGTADARQAACTRARNLLTGTKEALERSVQRAETCQTSAEGAGKTAGVVVNAAAKAALEAALAEIENTGLASPEMRQSLLQLAAVFASGAPAPETLAEITSLCADWQTQLLAAQTRQQAASALLEKCPASGSESTLQALSPAGESSAAARWPMLWGASACDFLLQEKGWWLKNQWADSVFYHFAPGTTPDDDWPLLAGHGPVRRLVIAAGAARAGQRRPGLTLADYLEGSHAEEGAGSAQPYFRKQEGGNDQIAF